MPAFYTHLRFGNQLLQSLSKETMRPVRHFRRLFEAGLQGPDFFFYHNPLVRTETVELGSRFHHQSGGAFFTQVCTVLREDPSEAGLAYLYGLLAHYCLDSQCHPFVHQVTKDGTIGHTELEVEFDRYLLAKDGYESPHTQDLSGRMKLTRGECVTVARFYPPATPGNVYQSVANMKRCMGFLAGKNRKFLAFVMKRTPASIQQQLMPEHANHKCLHLNKDMMALYEEAAQSYPVLLAQLLSHLERETPLGKEFERDFG